MRTTAAEAGRDAGALEYTRWGAIDMSEADVDACAGNGVTRLVVAPLPPTRASSATKSQPWPNG